MRLIVLLSLIGCFIISGCGETDRDGETQTGKIDAAHLSRVAKALAKGDQQIVAQFWLSVLDEMNANSRVLVVEGLSDPDADVRYLCAMSFFTVARDVAPEQALSLYNQLKDDHRIRWAFISSVYLSLGGFQDSHRITESASAPASSLALLKKFQQESGGAGVLGSAPPGGP